jgi:catechol 2,3-dioxygenase-like lactoylglutathione lyase family enzyme
MGKQPGSPGWADDVGTELFMTELHVADWPATVGWYVEVLGLRLLRSDAERRFALLAAGNGRMALRGVEAPAGPATGVRLVFLVADVDAEHERLRSLGVEASPPADHPREPYRETRLTGPEGTPITLFAWSGL